MAKDARKLGVNAELIQPGQLPWPTARTSIPVVEEVHPVSLSEDSILFCCHATDGTEQALVIERDFIADLMEAQDNDAILARVIDYANRVAAATWN